MPGSAERLLAMHDGGNAGGDVVGSLCESVRGAAGWMPKVHETFFLFSTLRLKQENDVFCWSRMQRGNWR